MYDSKGRARIISTSGKGPKYVQKGLREKLLCPECEQVINVYESYFKAFWYDKPALPRTVRRREFVVGSIDYAKFKLFHLSVLWRAGASSRVYPDVSLGSHSSRIRQMLLCGDPGPQHHYPFGGLLTVDHEGTVQLEAVTPPYSFKYKRFSVYAWRYAGCEWHYFVSRRRSLRIPFQALLPRGDLVLPVIPFTQGLVFEAFADDRRRSTRH
ncbi:MAG: hypothetical protein O7H41_15010 [Planctomycetota bacterium]|nr:hypothetical protein [Planctomycetota bacterium]